MAKNLMCEICKMLGVDDTKEEALQILYCLAATINSKNK